ncbi:MAG: TlpA family protein disulfide reductase [Candidatus Heimdallarchaeota archaeon]|nr:MAG: TlpA family protein disulfide reductase [Candidatus Heimdallarchaeota archaeon]
MSRRQRRRIPKGKKEENSSYEEVLEGLDRIQNRMKREVKSKVVKSRSYFNIFIILAVVVVISSIGIGVLFPTIPQNSSSNKSSESTGENPSTDTLKLIFQDLDSTNFNLIQYRGQHIILDFMGTYCEPCAKQIEILKEFTEQYPYVVIISASSEDITHLATYKTQNKISWKIVKDIYSVSTTLQITYIPTIIHFSPEYTETHRNVGLTDVETLSSWVS